MNEGKRKEEEMERFKSLWFLTATVFFVLALFVSGQAGAAEKVIKIGTLIPLTGSLSALGVNARYGCDMAAEEINAAGGIKSLGGAKIQMVHGDSEGKADTGMSVAERLIKQEGVNACLSGPQSGVTFATTQITEKYQIPHMVTGSVADSITGRGFKYVFRIIPTATYWSLSQLKVIEEMCKKGHKIQNIALFYEDTLWGQSQAKVWREKKGDLKIVADLSYPHGTSDLTVSITKLKAAKPDVVLICSYVSDAILMTRTMYEMDFNCQGIIGSGAGPEDPLFYKNLKDLTENVMTIAQFSDELNPFCQAKAVEYQKKYHQPMGGHSANAYAGIYVLADAFNRAGSMDSKKVRDALSKTNLCTSPANKILSTKKCITFDSTGQFNYWALIVQWRKGKLVPVFPDDIALAEPVWPMPTWKERGLKK
jgi:branched-chain amino acid transport system substrate-binding protein